jgi:hypothetical protein
MMFCYLIFVFGAAYCYNFRNNDTCLNFHVTSFNTCVGSSDSIKLTPISRLSLHECVSQCAVRGNCAGLIYRRKNLFCQLFKELNSTQEAKGDCVYIKRSDIFTVSMLCVGLCWINTCMQRVLNEYICQYTGCVKFCDSSQSTSKKFSN